MSRVFAWEKAVNRGEATMIRVNKTMAKSSSNSDFKEAHVDWCRDASGDNPNYTQLIKQTKEKCKKNYDDAMARRKKTIGR